MNSRGEGHCGLFQFPLPGELASFARGGEGGGRGGDWRGPGARRGESAADAMMRGSKGPMKKIYLIRTTIIKPMNKGFPGLGARGSRTNSIQMYKPYISPVVLKTEVIKDDSGES